jgi:hypothetical protein
MNGADVTSPEISHRLTRIPSGLRFEDDMASWLNFKDLTAETVSLKSRRFVKNLYEKNILRMSTSFFFSF